MSVPSVRYDGSHLEIDPRHTGGKPGDLDERSCWPDCSKAFGMGTGDE